MADAPATEVVRGPGTLVVVVFPATWLALEVDDTDRNPRTAERPETARQVWQRIPSAVALLDGPMFRTDDGRDYATSQRAELLYRYLDTARNVDVPSQYPTRGATLSVDASGRASMIQGAAEVRDARFAVQGYPEIVRRGENVGSREHDTDTNKRAALVLLSDGRVGFAISRSGIRAMGDLLLGARASNNATVTDAVYTDGGGSMALALRGPGGRDLVAENLDGRRLPVFLLALVPPGGAPGNVSRAWVGTVAGMTFAGLLLGFAKWWRESRERDQAP